MNVKEQAQLLADELLGTGNSLPEWVIDYPLLCHELDQLVMCCECCSWWCEISEFTDLEEIICQDCKE